MYAMRRFLSLWSLLVMVMLAVGPQAVLAILDAPEPSNNMDHFKYCLRRKQQPNLRECIGRTAISFLQRFDEKENYTIASGFVSTKDEKASGRSLVNFLDADPVDFRGILENAGAVFSQRSLEWHMDTVYPGLMFKVGPTADANSLAEFVLDPTIDERQFAYEEPSTARVLAKQYLVPFLLGLKFNLAVLVPLLFAGVMLLLKKSLFLAKLAIYVSSILGVGGTLSAISGFGGGFGGFGGLGGLGGLGGIRGVLGGGGALPPQPIPAGYFPGKTSVFSHYDEGDELHHNHHSHSGPYKRTDRKVSFDKPRESVALAPSTGGAPATSTAPRPDRFYDYERQVMMQDRSGRPRTSNGKLGPSAFGDADDGPWKVVDLRV